MADPYIVNCKVLPARFRFACIGGENEEANQRSVAELRKPKEVLDSL